MKNNMPRKIKENTPILVANEEWPLPENLIQEIKSERMINGLLDMATPGVLDKEDLVGWAECVGYLMPATQKKPLRDDVSKIYLYCVKKLLERQKKEVLKEFKDIELSDYQKGRLKEFKLWIYEKRGGKENNPILSVLKEVFLIPKYE
jgi:hypothetical protein